MDNKKSCDEGDTVFICAKCKIQWLNIAPGAMCPACRSCFLISTKRGANVCCLSLITLSPDLCEKLHE